MSHGSSKYQTEKPSVSELDKISIVIPTYNERENITLLIRKIMNALKNNFEVIIVDDSSPDGTSQAVADFSKRYKNIRLIVRSSKMGLASAVIDGFESSNAELLGAMDADLQHNPSMLPRMIEETRNGADIVIASRYCEGSLMKGWSAGRKIVSKVASLLAHIFLPRSRGISDPLSGFFLLKKEVLNKARLDPIGFKILLEILVKGSYAKVVEVPYGFETRKSGQTKLRGSEYFSYMRHLMKLIINGRRKGTSSS